MPLSAFLTSPLWTPVGVAFGAILAVFLGWWFWRARTHLYYGMPLVTPLLNVSPAARDRLVLSVGGVPLSHPHHVEVQLVSNGPRDISADDFQGALIFDVGADIIDMIGKPRVEPAKAQTPNVTRSGSTISLAKCLVKRRERITVSLLVDGDKPHLTHNSGDLLNADVEPFTGDPPPIGPWIKARNWAGGICILYNVSGCTASLFAHSVSDPHGPFIPVAGSLIWLWIGLAVLTAVLKRTIGRY